MSTQAKSVETASPTTSHDIAQHTMMNALHVEVRDTGQDAAKKRNTQRKSGDKADIIEASPVTISIKISEELSTGNKPGKS